MSCSILSFHKVIINEYSRLIYQRSQQKKVIAIQASQLYVLYIIGKQPISAYTAQKDAFWHPNGGNPKNSALKFNDY